MDIIGDPWTPLVLRDAFHGVRRFDDFQKSLGIARNTLADRLRRLVDGGLLKTQLYQDNPPRNEYVLTEMGDDFFPVMAAMVSWGDRWLDGGAGAPVVLHHASGDHAIEPEITCAHCRQALARSETEFWVGPGYPARVAKGVPDIRPRLKRNGQGT